MPSATRRRSAMYPTATSVSKYLDWEACSTYELLFSPLEVGFAPYLHIRIPLPGFPGFDPAAVINTAWWGLQYIM